MCTLAGLPRVVLMTTGNEPSITTWPQARIAPPWRDRGTWVQLVVQFILFGLGMSVDFGASFAEVPLWSDILRNVGYVVVFIALIVQRYSVRRGVPLTAVGLVFVGISGTGTLLLAYGVVVYEAWYISAYQRRLRVWLGLLAAGSLLSIANFVVKYPNGVETLDSWPQMGGMAVLALVSIALGWQLGLGTRKRVRDVSELAAKAELAALAERTRIAREMHDIIAHSLTAIIAQSDGGRYAARKDPKQAVTALETIGGTGREALVQMRQLLSVLREDDSRTLEVAPGLTGIPSLVASAERDGLRVDFRQDGEPRAVGESAGLAIYRIVQEGLTNILKHAGRTDALVVFEWHPADVEIRIDNAPGDGLVDSAEIDGDGRGLSGIAERARVLGGSANWGESQEYRGGFTVKARLAI